MEREQRKPLEQHPDLRQPKAGIRKSDKIVQASGFGVNNTANTQCDYMLVAVTESGRVLMSIGDGQWSDVTGP